MHPWANPSERRALAHLCRIIGAEAGQEHGAPSEQPNSIIKTRQEQTMHCHTQDIQNNNHP